MKKGTYLVDNEDIGPSYCEGATEADTWEVLEINSRSMDGKILTITVRVVN